MYWTPISSKRKEEIKLFIFLLLDKIIKEIIFSQSHNPIMWYDELTQELLKAQLTLDILESIIPSSSVRRNTNETNQIHVMYVFKNSNLKNLNQKILDLNMCEVYKETRPVIVIM